MNLPCPCRAHNDCVLIRNPICLSMPHTHYTTQKHACTHTDTHMPARSLGYPSQTFRVQRTPPCWGQGGSSLCQLACKEATCWAEPQSIPLSNSHQGSLPGRPRQHILTVFPFGGRGGESWPALVFSVPFGLVPESFL